MTNNSHRILLVDDEASILETVGFSLAMDFPDREIKTASNGKEALALVLANPPDVIVSDINMPEMDGLTLLQHLREREIFIPVIFMTAFSDLNSYRKAWALGAFDFIEKPFEVEKMRSTVRIALALGENYNRMRFAPTASSLQTLSLRIPPDLLDKLKHKSQADSQSTNDYIIDLLTKAS